MTRMFLIGAFIGAVMMMGGVTAAEARQITVCGKVNVGKCLTAKVRTTSRGEQYRVGNGNWHNCRGDCEKTLRRNRADFFFYQGG
jgi:hypothetical protein